MEKQNGKINLVPFFWRRPTAVFAISAISANRITEKIIRELNKKPLSKEKKA